MYVKYARALVVQLLDAGVLVFFLVSAREVHYKSVRRDEACLFDLEMLLPKHEPQTEQYNLEEENVN